MLWAAKSFTLEPPDAMVTVFFAIHVVLLALTLSYFGVGVANIPDTA